MSARRSRHTAMRAFQSSSVSGAVTVPKLVFSSSARAIDVSTSHALRPSESAISPTKHPRYCSFSGATTSWILRLPHLAIVGSGLSERCACSSSHASLSSSAKNSSFSASGRPITASQPGMASRMKPDRNERYTGKLIGTVSATTRPPCSRASVARFELALRLLEVPGAHAQHVPVELVVAQQPTSMP